MHIVCHKTLLAARHIEPLPMCKRIADVVETALPMLVLEIVNFAREALNKAESCNAIHTMLILS